MKRRGRRWVLFSCMGLAGASGAAYVAWAGLPRFGGSASGDVPTHAVQSAPFLRTVRAEGFLKPTITTPVSAPSEGRAILIAWVAEDGLQVKKGDVVVRFDDTDLSRILADSQGDQQQADHKITKEKVQIQNQLSERNRTSALTEEEIKRAKELGKKDPRFFPRSEVIESEIDEGLLRSRLSQTLDARKVEEKLAQTRVALVTVERKKAALETKAAKDALGRLEIRAPHDGTFIVQRWNNRTIQSGDRAFAGMRIGEIARNDKMDAEIFVLEVDAGGLVPGKSAKVIVEARGEIAFNAKVKQVDPFPKPRSPEIPAQYFGALLGIEGEVKDLKPGQRLHATITIEEIPDALAIPRQAIFRGDEGPFVYLRKGPGNFQEQAVKLGAGTVAKILVTKGISAGDVVAMRNPNKSADETVAESARKSNRGAAPAPSTGESQNMGRRRGP